MRSGVRATLGLESGQVVEAEELPQRGCLRLHRRELVALGVVLGEGEHRLRVREDVLALRCRVRRVDPDDDGSDRHHRPVEQHPLEPRARDDGDSVASADSVREQRVGERLDALTGLLPRHLPPARAVLLEVRRHREPLVEDVAPERRRRAGRQGPLRGWRRLGGRRRHRGHRIPGRERWGGGEPPWSLYNSWCT